MIIGMKIKAYKKGYYYILALCLFLPLLFVYVLSIGASLYLTMLTISFCVALVVFLFTAGRSMITVLTINEQGVSAKAFGRKVGSLLWEEMAEVGIGMQGIGRKGQHFLYFVRYPLNEIQRHMIMNMMQNDSAIWVQLTKQSLEAVTTYYKGYIHQMELML